MTIFLLGSGATPVGHVAAQARVVIFLCGLRRGG